MATSQRRRRRPWYRRVTLGHAGLVLLGVFVLLILVFAWQALRASQTLRLAASQAELLQNQVIAGDDRGAEETLAALQESTERARSLTDGPLWDAGAKVPYLGQNVRAVQTVSDVIDQVAAEAAPPVVALSREINLNTFSPKDGRVDIASIRRIRPSVTEAAEALGAAQRRLDSVHADALLVPLRGPVGTIQVKIAGAAAAASNSQLAADLLPSMLGQNETRRYLLLVQNNAEVRSTGGISGSFAILEAAKGKLTMGFQGSVQDLMQFPEPVVKMTDGESRIYAPTLVTNILDANFTPDFPRTGVITRAMVDRGLGVSVDGVISVDPVAMSFILAGTGPVQTGTPGVVLDQSNAVDLLLNTTYMLLKDRDQQDGVFEMAARRIFDVVRQGRGDTRAVIAGLVQGVSENRIMVWSSHREEQKLIRPSALSGALIGDDGPTPHVGMYLGDAASTKMEYYLDHSTNVTARRCLPGDIQELTSTTELTSRAPSNAAKLPFAVAGDGQYTPKGTMRLIARFYGPYGGGFTEVRLDGKKQTVYADKHKGRNVTKVLLTIKPGQTRTITTAMITGRGQGGDGVFSTTPGVRSMRNDETIWSACK